MSDRRTIHYINIYIQNQKGNEKKKRELLNIDMSELFYIVHNKTK